jgi:ParB-like chromosome segregation protein Spo0J
MTNCNLQNDETAKPQSGYSDLQNHPLADMFPMLSDAEQNELAADIGKHGQLEPIVLYQEMILDGRNRNTACLMLGIEPKTVEFTGDNPVAYVVSKNLKRRHLNESQRAMIATELEQYAHGGARNNQDANGHLETRAELAASLDVSPRSVARAKKVKESGTPEDVQAVKDGKLSVSAAEKKIKSNAKKNEVAEDAEFVEDEQETTQLTTSKTPASLIERTPAELKVALALPINSQQRSDSLDCIFGVITEKGFSDNKVRREFVRGILVRCIEYLPKDEVNAIIQAQ